VPPRSPTIRYREYVRGGTDWGVRIPAGVRDFASTKRCQHWLWGPPSLLFNGYRSYFTAARWPGLFVWPLTSI